MNRTKRLALILTGLAASIGLVVPAATAATAQPDFRNGPFQVCANGGAGLCLQNNASLGSLVANDNSNPSSDTQKVSFIIASAFLPSMQETTQHSSGSFIGYPFNSAALNNQIAVGRTIFGMESLQSGDTLCLNENDFSMDLGFCSGSQSGYVESGSGRIVSIGASNAEGKLEFVRSNGANGGNPQVGANTCPGACWATLP